MTPCTAHEFIESRGRTGHVAQFLFAGEAAMYGIKVELYATWYPNTGRTQGWARTAATLAMIAFPDLRDDQ